MDFPYHIAHLPGSLAPKTAISTVESTRGKRLLLGPYSYRDESLLSETNQQKLSPTPSHFGEVSL